MKESLTSYVNSTMNEFHDYGSELYEGLIDMDHESVIEAITKLKKLLSDIQKSYYD